jgi:hypothetical protein
MKILLDKNETLEILHNALCNGLGYLSEYGLQVDITDEEYRTAKANVVQENTICYEDVLIQHIKDGNALRFKDFGGYDMDGRITLEDAIENLGDEDIAHRILEMKNEEDDAETADCILQYCLYGSIVFG